MITSTDSPRLVEGQVAAIFGGASGLGKAVALAFARHGAAAIHVADARREPRDGSDPVEGQVTAASDSVRFAFHKCDVRDPRQVQAAIAQAELHDPLDVVINTAGIYWRRNLLDTDVAAFDELLSVNLRGSFLVAQAAARHMVRRGEGLIINTGSGAGIRGSSGFAAYCASKGGLRLLTYTMAAELGPAGIRVNQVDPAFMDTEMTRSDVPAKKSLTDMIPMQRASSVAEVADAYVYLASPLGSYVNGHCLAVDGGYFTTTPETSEWGGDPQAPAS